MMTESKMGKEDKATTSQDWDSYINTLIDEDNVMKVTRIATHFAHKQGKTMKDFGSEAWKLAEKCFYTPLHKEESFDCRKCGTTNTYKTAQLTHEIAAVMIFLSNVNSNI